MGFLDDYEPVEDRLREFWRDHPDGRIKSVLIEHADGSYIVKALIYRDATGPISSTGLAHDSVDQLPQNMKASALETCETSAIGRALANLGYAPKGKRPSREEMQKASPPPQADRAASAPVQDAPAASDGGQPPSPGTADAPNPETQQLLDQLKRLTGSATKAREQVNAVHGTDYTVRTIVHAPVEQVRVAVAEWLETHPEKATSL